ncbi:hypothetical protein HK098_007427 [Nowakowskiella sp. JEL0407]|nr:hypothetical protein HK098_007427 [Nowakowskiella sp. JEL0407]
MEEIVYKPPSFAKKRKEITDTNTAKVSNSPPVRDAFPSDSKRNRPDGYIPDPTIINTTVADHYNSRPNQGRQQRRESPIFRLRGFNNWVKSILISKYVKRGDVVLDMCCGKGGDLEKFCKAEIGQLLGLDVAEQSIEHARERYSSKNYRFPASFHAVDCFTDGVINHFSNLEFDLVTLQFALHYSFENEQRARQALFNISSRMRPGAVFLGTIPDALWIVKKFMESEKHSFGNSIYQISYTKTHFGDNSPFGNEYYFKLSDAVDCPEYLVHFSKLCTLASEYGLELIEKKGFHELFLEGIETEENRNLLLRMNVLDQEQSLSDEEWEAAGIYMAFAFRKI